MIKLDYIVKVYTGVADNLPLLGNVSGVATWSTADQSLGILSDSFFRDVQSKVDISIGGNYSQYTDLKINIVRSALVETTLKNYDTTLIGKRIELSETNGVKTRMLYRGVIRQLSAEENETELTCSHLANSYAVDMTKSIGKEKLPLVFGQSVKNVKLITQELDKLDGTVIGDGLFPTFVVIAPAEPYSLEIRSVYDTSVVTQQVLLDWMVSAPFNNLKISGNGNTLLAKITNFTITQYGVDVGYTCNGFTCNLVPMNMVDGDGTPFFNVDSEVTVEYVTYPNIYFPTGVPVSIKNVVYEDGGNFYPLPTYLDSYSIGNGSIQIPDADNIGLEWVKPFSVNAFAVVNGRVTPIPEGATTFPMYGSNVTFTAAGIEDYKNGEQSTIEVQSSTLISSTVNIQCGYDYVLKISARDVPENLYDTMYADVEQLAPNSIEVYLGIVKSIITQNSPSPIIIQDNNTSVGGAYNPRIVYQAMLPEEASSNGQNFAFRWANNGFGYGLTRDLYETITTDWQKVSRIIVRTTFTINKTAVATGVEVTASQKIARNREYDISNLFLSSVEGIKDISNSVITDTATAYKTALNKQNYETAGIAIPSGGWGLAFPIDSIADVIDPAISPTAIPLSWQTQETNTKDVKLEMLRYTAGIGFIDILGRESWRSAVSTGTGIMFTPHEIKGKPRVEIIDSRKVYPEIGITYGNGSINITNTEKEIYSTSYVTGVTDADTARDLWYAGRLIYKRYRTKNDLPKKYADVSGIINESDAVDYIKNMYRLNGILFNGTVILSEKYECTFATSEEYIFTNDLQLGDKITLVYPNVAEDGNNGIITGISHGKDGESAIVAMMTGSVLETVESFDIIETGSQADSIIESGSQANNYYEGKI